MQLRRSAAWICCLSLFVLTSCTARYQDLLRDRDAQIRELNGRVAQLRATNDDLERQKNQAEQEADMLRQRMQDASVARPVESDLSGLQDRLPDTEVRYSRGRISIGIENAVTFDSGSTALKNSAHQVLRRVAEVLKSDFNGRRIYVEGHTDSDPIRRTKDKYRDNRHLSVERADAVARYLISQCGIPESRIVVVGFGPHDPRATGGTDAAKGRNRRVEIVVGEPVTP